MNLNEILKKLIEQHGPALAYYIHQLAPSWADNICDDVLQEAFVLMLRKKPSPERLLPWLYATVRRLTLFRLRTEGRRVHHETKSIQAREIELPPWHVDDLDQRDLTTRMMRQLDDLEPDQREIVVMHIWGNLSFKEIAEILDGSPSRANRHYQQAIAILQEAMQEIEN